MRCAVAGVLCTLGLVGPTFAQDTTPVRKKQVVVLYSFQTLMPVNADRDRGIRRAIAAACPQDVEVDVEYLDLSRYGKAEYARQWIALLQTKYADRKVDLVIPVAAHAIEFVLAHRAVLFPEVPIVFCGAGADLAQRACAVPNVTGVAYRFNADDTLDAAWAIYPQAERLLVICGASDQDKQIRALATSVASRYERILDVDYLDGLPLPELLDRVAAVDANSIVLMLTYNADSSGEGYVTREVVEKVSDVCPAPVFGLWDTLLGHGIVGGSLIGIEKQGELAGQMAARVLQGQRPSEIPVAGLTTNQLIFDARQLRRWRIREDSLPKGALLRYREATFWEQYGNYLVAALLVLALQSVAIFGLLVNRSRRRRAEWALAGQFRFASLLSEATSRFVHLPPDRVGQEITRTLGQIAKFLKVDEALLFRISMDTRTLDVIHSWIKDSKLPVTKIRLAEIPEIWNNLACDKVSCFATTTDLPTPSRRGIDQREIELFERLGLKSGIAIPLSASGAAFGMLAFGAPLDARRWDDHTVQGLKLIGEVFANALAYEQAVEALHTSRTEARHLAGRLLTAQEDESKRLARELHDDLSQRLAATAIEVGKLEQQSVEAREWRARLNDLKNALVTIAEDVHQISRQIHPAILDDLGLEDALRSECVGFAKRHGLVIQFRCRGLSEELPKEVTLCLYRIVQEALQNIAKHAMTNIVSIALSADTEFAYLVVRDAGRGFDRNEAQGRPGLGLASMEERVRLVGGDLTVSSKPSQGTEIKVRIPLLEEDV